MCGPRRRVLQRRGVGVCEWRPHLVVRRDAGREDYSWNHLFLVRPMFVGSWGGRCFTPRATRGAPCDTAPCCAVTSVYCRSSLPFNNYPPSMQCVRPPQIQLHPASLFVRRPSCLSSPSHPPRPLLSHPTPKMPRTPKPPSPTVVIQIPSPRRKPTHVHSPRNTRQPPHKVSRPHLSHKRKVHQTHSRPERPPRHH